MFLSIIDNYNYIKNLIDFQPLTTSPDGAGAPIVIGVNSAQAERRRERDGELRGQNVGLQKRMMSYEL